jgi:hypothetical protein
VQYKKFFIWKWAGRGIWRRRDFFKQKVGWYARLWKWTCAYVCIARCLVVVLPKPCYETTIGACMHACMNGGLSSCRSAQPRSVDRKTNWSKQIIIIATNRHNEIYLFCSQVERINGLLSFLALNIYDKFNASLKAIF